MKRAALYCRLSDEDKDKINGLDLSQSIQNQISLLEEYAVKQNWIIYKVYSDDDYSGWDKDRPAFNELIRDAIEGRFDIVLCKTQSRFVRDIESLEKYVHDLFPKIGIRFVGLIDHIDTDVRGNKKARQINGLVNEWYCDDLSDNIRAVFKKKMTDGQCLLSFLSYGYMKDPANRHKVVVDEEAAQVVRMIFHKYLEGYGTTHIANELTKRGILTPANYKVSKGLNFKTVHNTYTEKGIWAYNTINKILKNEIYIGTLAQGKETTSSYKSKDRVMRPREDWIIIENNHEAIISRDVFYTASQLLKANRKAVKCAGHSVLPHIFAGKIKCKECGSSMISSGSTEINGVKYDYLVCKGQRKSKNKDTILCEAKGTLKLNILVDTIERLLREKIDMFLEINRNMKAIKNSCDFKNDLFKKITAIHKEILQIEAALKKITNTLSALYMDKADGIVTQEHYMELYNKFSFDANNFKEKRSALEKELEIVTNRTKIIEDPEKLVKKFSYFKSLTHDIVNQFIDYIEIGKADEEGNREIIVHWLF